QFSVIIYSKIVGETRVSEWMWSTHKPLGVLLMAMIVLRILWSLKTLKTRPLSTNQASRFGHIILYFLMFAVPVLALLRQYGSGKSFEIAGFTIFSGFDGQKIEWMMTLGSLFHGELGILMGIIVVGHIFMAIAHKRKTKSNAIFRKIL